jgi:hypothetical protein
MRFRSMSSNLAGRTFRQCEVSPAVRTWQDNTLGLHGTSPLALELQLAMKTIVQVQHPHPRYSSMPVTPKATQCRRLTLLKAEVATPVCAPRTTPYCGAYQIWTSWGPWQDVIHDSLPHVPTEYSAFGLQFPWSCLIRVYSRISSTGLYFHLLCSKPRRNNRTIWDELVRLSVTTLGQFGASYRDQSGCHKVSRGSFLASLSTVSR